MGIAAVAAFAIPLDIYVYMGWCTSFYLLTGVVCVFMDEDMPCPAALLTLRPPQEAGEHVYHPSKAPPTHRSRWTVSVDRQPLPHRSDGRFSARVRGCAEAAVPPLGAVSAPSPAGSESYSRAV